MLAQSHPHAFAKSRQKHMNTSLIVASLEAVDAAILANESSIESLDRAIGDGDHYLNIRRGCQVLMNMRADLAAKPPGPALHAIGMKLLSTIGGASGPLISSFFMAMAKSLGDSAVPSRRQVAQAFAAGVEAIKLRGKADVGEKTMLDVLIPASSLLNNPSVESIPLKDLCDQLNAQATRNMLATRDMIATKGRASYLGERAIGHIDPGCKTCEVLIAAVIETVLSHQSTATTP
jgi:phosphoenolpyruvate---glycerone phosphotransferase subunit DhaL